MLTLAESGQVGLTILLFIIMLPLAAMLIWLPQHLAKKNHHPNVNGVSTLAVLGLIIWPLWIVALVWAIMGGKPGQQRTSDVSAPAATTGTKFRVIGEDDGTGMVRTVTVAASSQTAAISQARQTGMNKILGVEAA